MPGTEDCDSNARGWVRWMRTATYQGHMGYNDVFGKDIVDALKGVALKQSLIKTVYWPCDMNEYASNLPIGTGSALRDCFFFSSATSGKQLQLLTSFHYDRPMQRCHVELWRIPA